MHNQNNKYTPVLVSADDHEMLLQIQELRRRAWAFDGEVPGFIAEQDILRDEHDVHGMHLGIMDEGKLIASARLCVHKSVSASPDPEALDGYEHLVDVPVGSLTRLVVDPGHRGRGLSAVLDGVRISMAKERGCKSMIGIAELEFRMRSLERLGFIRLGPTKIRYLASTPSFVLLLKFP